MPEKIFKSPSQMLDDDYWISGNFEEEGIGPIVDYGEDKQLIPYLTLDVVRDQKLHPEKWTRSFTHEDLLPTAPSRDMSRDIDLASDYSSEAGDEDATFFGMPAGGKKQHICVCCTFWVCCCCCLWTVIIVTSLVIGKRFVTHHRETELPLGVDCAPGVDFCNWNQGTNTPPNNITRYLRWPGCEHIDGPKLDSILLECGPPCYDYRFAQAMEHYNSRLPWSMVTFPSAPGEIEGQEEVADLTGWWLPADEAYNLLSPGNRTPVVIIQHGMAYNFNSLFVQVYAYLLRSVGFSVFIPNLRNHGNSGKSSRNLIRTWGYTYYLDLLGAWYHVVNDPSNIFGGPRPTSQVGIAGLESGAFIAATALGVNHLIPAAWLDSGMYDVEAGPLTDMLSDLGYHWFFGWFFRLLTPLTWDFAKMWAEGDIGYRTPANSLSCNNTIGDGIGDITQKVAIISNVKEHYEIRAEARNLKDKIQENSGCYTILQDWEADSECHGSVCAELFSSPEVYRAKSCEFWSAVFQRPETACYEIYQFPVLKPVLESPPRTGSSATSYDSFSGPSSKSTEGISKFADESSLSRSSLSSSSNSFRSSFSSITSWFHGSSGSARSSGFTSSR